VIAQSREHLRLRKEKEEEVMSSIRILSLAVGVVLALSSVACIAAKNENEEHEEHEEQLPSKTEGATAPPPSPLSGLLKHSECVGCVSDDAGACYWGTPSKWGEGSYPSSTSGACSSYCCE
jgi:hypothetical protein